MAGALVAGARAQGTPPPTFRIGYISLNTPDAGAHVLAAFRKALQERGWSEGRSIRFEPRYADGRVDRLPALANELVQMRVDVIVTGSSVSTRAAKDATKSIPIVMAASADAVGEGLVASLAHPGGNVTGVTFLAGTEIAPKQLELLKQVVPTSTRVAILSNPSNPAHAAFVRDLKVAGPKLGIQLQVMEARNPDDLGGAFEAIKKDRAGAVLALTDSMFFGQRHSIVKLAERSALPVMYSQREFVEAGGLISYGPSLQEMFRRAAVHVDKILRGAKPGDLPVEQPTKFDLVVNLKTARTLGLTLPQSVSALAEPIQ